MIKPRKESKLLFWSFLSLFVFEFIYILHDAEININSDNFFPLLYISFVCLLILYTKNSWKKDIPRDAITVYHLIIFWNLVAIARGMITATGYLDWKNTLIHTAGGLSLLIPFAMMAGVSFLSGRRLLRLCMYIFLGSFLMIPVALSFFNEIYPRFVTPVAVFILFIPYYKNKERIIIVLVAAIAVGIALSWRANVLRISFSFIFLMIYFFRKSINAALLTVVQIIFFVVPFYFLYQGLNGDSIFAKGADTEYTVTANGEESNLAADTRTDLYSEVLTDLKTTGNLWIGKGSNGKYRSDHDWELIAELGDERPAVEVGFLKILLYNGIIGMILFTIITAIAVYYGTWRSNNTLTKMLSMFLASHWLILFLENSIEYAMYFYFSWIVIGLCLSKKIRALDDTELKEWFRSKAKLR